jgi:N-acetylmuramoyl-L-alanine amidase
MLLLSMASPAAALAKTIARISVPATIVSISTSTYAATGTVTYARHGAAAPIPAQYVRIHRYDPMAKTWVYVAQLKTDSVGAFKMTLAGGELYRYSYAGSSKFHSASAKVRVDLLPGTPPPFVVTIDAGHQSIHNHALEPIGPGSKVLRPKAVSGTQGIYTRTPEYTRNLQVSVKLRYLLVRQGVKVVMIRTRNAVNIPNSTRAKIANAAGSSLFIRVHCDGSTIHSKHGISTLTPGLNAWTGPVIDSSLAAATLVHQGMLDRTGAADRGVVPRTDMAGFNWAKVPSVIVEMGFMSNIAEDRLLAIKAYRDKLAAGILDGTMAYLRSR